MESQSSGNENDLRPSTVSEIVHIQDAEHSGLKRHKAHLCVVRAYQFWRSYALNYVSLNLKG